MSDTTDSFEWVELPSKGECYPKSSPLRKGKVAVYYLLAADEDIINSPLLYEKGIMVETILRRKLVDKTIDPLSLCKGDLDAILIWLRRTAYGDEFPVDVVDSYNGETLETLINLSQLTYNDFQLSGDENGCFTFHLKGEHVFTYKYLTIGDIKMLEENSTNEEGVERTILKHITIAVNNETEREHICDVIDSLSNDEVLFYTNYVMMSAPNINTTLSIKVNDEREITAAFNIEGDTFLNIN